MKPMDARQRWIGRYAGLLLVAGLLSASTAPSGSLAFAPLATVTASVETAPVPHVGDAADDPAIWIHPADPSLSTIIGTNKKGGLEVYDLSGAKLQVIPVETGNVDIRYNFPLAGQKIALVAAYNQSQMMLAAYRVNPTTRLLEDVSAPNTRVTGGGTALYRSPRSGKYYYFSNMNNVLRQYELFENGAGQVSAKLVRTVEFGSYIDKTESVVADDILAKVYVSEEAVAIWRLPAEPNRGDTKIQVDTPVTNGGNFTPDIEGLAIYYKNDGTGYLLASSQGSNTYLVYDRKSPNTFLGSFQIASQISRGKEVDGTSDTDGIDVTNFPLGPLFSTGVFIAQDGSNYEGGVKTNQNFKLVRWARIAQALGLTSDPRWDPRQVGK